MRNLFDWSVLIPRQRLSEHAFFLLRRDKSNGGTAGKSNSSTFGLIRQVTLQTHLFDLCTLLFGPINMPFFHF